MLDSHPEVACGSELRLVHVFANLWRNVRDTRGRVLGQYFGVQEEQLKSLFAASIGEILDRYRTAQGKARVAEKTPVNVTVFPLLHELFPDSPLIHIIRDGRDVVASLQEMPWKDERSGQPMDIVRDVEAAAATWVECVRTGLSMRDFPASSTFYHEIRYEALIADPAPVLANLLDFLGLKWCDRVLEFHRNPRIFSGTEESSARQVAQPLYGNAVGRWHHDLTREQVNAVMAVAGPLLSELEYCARA